MKKALTLFIVFAMLIGGLTACAAKESAATEPAAPETTQTVAAAAETPAEESSQSSHKLAVITGTGGLGDQNMNDFIYAGVQKHEAEGVTVDVVQPKDVADFPNLQTLYAEEGSYDAIVCIGFDQLEALKSVGPNFPDQRFLLCDTTLEADNVTSVLFRAEETGFQLGVLAGPVEKDGALPNSRGANTIGFVGGKDIATINQFAAGYEAGARLVNPEITVLRTYVGSFGDPATATELATSLYEQGADIVFACAGSSGLGVFTAAEKQNGYALGIETNQNVLYPDQIIASGTRAWDSAIYDATQRAMDGTLDAGILSYGIVDGMLKAEREGSNVAVSDEAIAALDEYCRKVADGTLQLPTTLDAVDAFLQANAE